MSDARSAFDPFRIDIKAFRVRYQAVLDALSDESVIAGNAATLVGDFLRSDVPTLIRSYDTTARAAERLEIALIAERVERARLTEERDLFQQELPVDRRRSLLDKLEQSRARRFSRAINPSDDETRE